ncbi:MAG: VanZ family protein [Prevotellaceae bacterium]|jgi:VanZ family protein|nr:VanZ family protein [Prevotellaceae bacterium]
MLKILKYQWRAILWIIVIVVACLTPGDKIPEVLFFAKIPHFDKIAHFMMYFIFTLFLMSGFSRQYGRASTKAYVSSLIYAFILGMIIEFIQEKVERSFDIYDMIANTSGIIVSLLLFKPVKWILRNIL